MDDNARKILRLPRPRSSVLWDGHFSHMVAGVSGGVVATLVLHPLDLVKIRFQGTDIVLCSVMQICCLHSSYLLRVLLLLWYTTFLLCFMQFAVDPLKKQVRMPFIVSRQIDQNSTLICQRSLS